MSWKTALWSLFLFGAGLVREGAGQLSLLMRISLCVILMPVEPQTMLLIGISELGYNHDRAIGMIVVGCLGTFAAHCTNFRQRYAPLRAAFLPGMYASYIMLGACLRWKGFKYSQIPSYDD